MAILELLYNKPQGKEFSQVVRTRRRQAGEIIMLGSYDNGNRRRMRILDDDTITLEEVLFEGKMRLRHIEHARLHAEEINKMQGIKGHVWGNFRHEYMWTPNEITPS